MQKITVITADVVGSRGAGLDEGFLSQALANIKHPQLIVPFSVSRGDELQGIMAGWLSAPQLVRTLRWHCQPLKLRVGLGTGEHSGDLGTDSWKLNGPAFFKARQALDSVADSKGAATRIITGTPELDSIVNPGLLLLDMVISGWTSGQWEAVMAYEQHGTFMSAAKILGVAPQNVQKRCKAAHWNHVRQAEQGLTGLEKVLQQLT